MVKNTKGIQNMNSKQSNVGERSSQSQRSPQVQNKTCTPSAYGQSGQACGPRKQEPTAMNAQKDKTAASSMSGQNRTSNMSHGQNAQSSSPGVSQRNETSQSSRGAYSNESMDSNVNKYNKGEY